MDDYVVKTEKQINCALIPDLHDNDGSNVTLSPEQSYRYTGILNSPID